MWCLALQFINQYRKSYTEKSGNMVEEKVKTLQEPEKKTVRCENVSLRNASEAILMKSQIAVTWSQNMNYNNSHREGGAVEGA